jgi:hypothetical protein
MTRQFTEQRKLRQGLAKIGGATLVLSLILGKRTGVCSPKSREIGTAADQTF